MGLGEDWAVPTNSWRVHTDQLQGGFTYSMQRAAYSIQHVAHRIYGRCCTEGGVVNDSLLPLNEDLMNECLYTLLVTHYS